MTQEKDHGRIERREYRLLTDISRLPGAADWRDLRAIGSATSTVIKGDNTHVETRYFISSLNNLDRFAYAVRKHWAIENQLHWCLDVIFDAEASQEKRQFSFESERLAEDGAGALQKYQHGQTRQPSEKTFLRLPQSRGISDDPLRTILNAVALPQAPRGMGRYPRPPRGHH